MTSPSLRSLPAYVGRAQELELLEDFLQRAVGGRSALVVVAGEAGIGKTRLLDELSLRAERQGVAVLAGHCYEDIASPYLPFLEALRRLLSEQTPSQLESTEDEYAGLKKLLPELAPAGDVESEAGWFEQPQRDKLRLFEMVARLLLHACQQKPLLLILEDLHWTDAATPPMLDHLARLTIGRLARESAYLLTIVTYRDEDVDEHHPLSRLLTNLERERLVDHVRLTGLQEPEVRQLIEGLGLARPSSQLVRTLHRTTGGNPFFIEQLVRQLGYEGGLRRRGGYWTIAPVPTELEIPATVKPILARRLSGLGDGSRRLLRVAACLGQRFSFETLAAVSEADETELLDALEGGLHLGILRDAGEEFVFSHALMRQALSVELSRPRRQRLHRQIGEGLERLFEGSLDAHAIELAQHTDAAGDLADPNKAARYCRAAGDRASEMCAYGDAARYYRGALHALARLDAPPHDMADLSFEVGLAHFKDGDYSLAADFFEQACGLYEQSEDSQGAAVARFHRGWIEALSSSPGEMRAHNHLQQALDLLSDTDHHLRGLILSKMSQMYFYARKSDRAEALALQTLEIADAVKDPALRYEASLSLGLVHFQTLRFDHALHDWDLGSQAVDELEDAWRAPVFLSRRPMPLTVMGRLEEARTMAEEAEGLAQRVYNWGEFSLAQVGIMAPALISGDLDTAEKHGVSGLIAAKRSSYPWACILLLPALACVRYLQGRFDEAEDVIQRLLTPGELFDDPGAVAFLGWIYHLLVEASSGDQGQARDSLPQAMKAVEAMGPPDILTLPALVCLAELAILLEETDLAQRQYEPLRAAADRGVQFGPGWCFLVPRVLGQIAGLAGRWDEAEHHYRTAVEIASRTGARTELARSNLEWARMLVNKGGTEGRQSATDLLTEATPILQEIGMEPLLSQAVELTHSLTARKPAVSPKRPSYPDDLTQREVEVLALVSEGRSNRDIAEGLFLSKKTVDRHLANIFVKIDVNSRTAAAAYAFARGLASPPSEPR